MTGEPRRGAAYRGTGDGRRHPGGTSRWGAYQVLDRGQADGILIRTPNQQWVVIDAGTNAQERDAMRDMGIDRVGLQRGDVLVEVDGTPIYAEDNPLWDVFATGSRVHLIVRRGGAPWETRIEVE